MGSRQTWPDDLAVGRFGGKRDRTIAMAQRFVHGARIRVPAADTCPASLVAIKATSGRQGLHFLPIPSLEKLERDCLH